MQRAPIEARQVSQTILTDGIAAYPFEAQSRCRRIRYAADQSLMRDHPLEHALHPEEKVRTRLHLDCRFDVYQQHVKLCSAMDQAIFCCHGEGSAPLDFVRRGVATLK